MIIYDVVNVFSMKTYKSSKKLRVGLNWYPGVNWSTTTNFKTGLSQKNGLRLKTFCESQPWLSYGKTKVDAKVGIYVPFNSQGHIASGPEHCHLWDSNPQR